ncbi:MAG: 5-dehydro-2-deoxygluconokinase [Proteobacteria bacterium]|nr:5-dehydro-2-deoxygluconokinase [Pseudomonadota bacterium]
MAERPLHLICMGRAAVDLYGEQIGSRLEDMSSFAKYLGGCAANIAFGAARLGLSTAMLTRVGDEHMGRFVRDELARGGVDVSGVKTDPQRLTGLVILGVKDRDTFPLIFYRENCADMALGEDDVDPAFIGSARALLVTGTHFSTPGTDAASRKAMRCAVEAGTRVILDIDYRPVLWGLTGRGAGQERYVDSAEVTERLQSIVSDCDLIVGTEEEIHIAGGSRDTLAALRRLRELSRATLVVKRGPLGCTVFAGDIPDSLDDGLSAPGFGVQVLNVLGAGDAFMAGFLSGWLRGESLEISCRYGNGCGALVVSRHGCAPAMPTAIELEAYLERAGDLPRPELDPYINRLHRVTTRSTDWPQLCILAFDHRRQLVDMANELDVDLGRIPPFKKLVATAVQQVVERDGMAGRAGVLIDDRFGTEALEMVTGGSLWIARPVEVPGSRPVRFEAGDNIAAAIRSWPAEHVVKCLVFYHPDDPAELREQQIKQVKLLYGACVATEHELLVEIIPPASMPTDATTVSRVMLDMYAAEIFPDWWKLPPPRDQDTWTHIEDAIRTRDSYCRGIVLLGLDAPLPELEAQFALAGKQHFGKGFAVGRSIFSNAARNWLAGAIGDDEAISEIATNYRRLIGVWTSSQNP